MSISFKLAPNNPRTFINLLDRCEPNGIITPFKPLAELPEELEKGNFLDLHHFIELIAYPLQSWEMTKEEKKEILQKISKIYPLNPNQESQEYKAYQKLIQIFKRITTIPEDLEERKNFVPVGLESFKESFTTLSFIPKNPIISPEKRMEKAKELLEFLKDAPLEKNLISTVLNILLLQHHLIELIWQHLEVEEAFDRYHEHFYGFGLSLEKTVLIRTQPGLIQRLPKEGDVYETASIEEIASLIKKKKSFTAVQKESRFIHKTVSQGKDLQDQYSCFLKAIEEKESKIALTQNDETLGAFLLTRSCLAKSKIKEAILAFQSLGLFKTNPYITRRIAAFLAREILYLEEEVQFNQEAAKSYSLDMSDLPFHQKSYHLCKTYEKEIACEQEIYRLFYEAFKQCKISNKTLGSSQTIFSPLPHKTIPSTLPALELPPFLPCHELLRRWLDGNAITQELKNSSTPDVMEPSDAIKTETNGYTKDHLPLPTKTHKTKKKKSSFLQDSFSEKRLPISSKESFDETLSSDGSSEKKISCNSLSEETISFFTYEPRVTRWFTHELPLSKEFFPEYSNYPLDYQKKMQIFHGFSLEVDSFAQQYGHQFFEENQKTKHLDSCYAIPGEITIEAQKYRGLFYYAIGLDNKVYHRYFSQKTTIDLIEIVNKAFYQIDFPELELSSQTSLEKKIFYPTESQETISQDLNSQIITITNPKNATTIKLIPLNEIK